MRMERIIDIPCVDAFIRLCAEGARQGWHERNGGNLTYRLTEADAAACAPFFDRASAAWTPLGVRDETLGGQYFLCTGSGRFMSNVARAPQENICIAQINPAGDAYRLAWGLTLGGRPTSEFPTHFLNHGVRARATDGRCRVIYHAHPPALIALTFLLPLTARAFTRPLWRAMTECPIIFPRGVGVVEWMVPGGADIARATCALMAQYDAVVWAHHGLFVSGPDFDEAFGLMHAIEKASDITLRVMQTGRPVLQTITDEDLRLLAKEFKVDLREEFLDGADA